MSNKLIRSIKDIFFDLPFSHDLKNKSRSILSQNKSFSNVPNVKRTYRNHFLIYKEPIVIISYEQIRDLQLFFY